MPPALYRGRGVDFSQKEKLINDSFSKARFSEIRACLADLIISPLLPRVAHFSEIRLCLADLIISPLLPRVVIKSAILFERKVKSGLKLEKDLLLDSTGRSFNAYDNKPVRHPSFTAGK
ncbi:hypothetical protein CDAR_125201 [Caerostris darwini]|uniref:Uncharacterized protein n=1 Tax=Caerostris darwini TaxID=1538125 RepID=A0AAV4NXF3_9ARAC|nr:hypothetical protein CDAR_125201 [Caerostris darwini]